MFLRGVERHASTSVNSDACPRPATGGESEGGIPNTTTQPPYSQLNIRAHVPRQVDAEGRVVEVEPLVDGIPALPDAVGLPPPSEVMLLV